MPDDTPSLLSSLQTIATIIATGGGTYIAFAGLRTWKSEMKGRRDIELCQHVIALFYEAEEKVRDLRQPMAYPAVESAERPKREGESDAEGRLRDTLYVPIARWRSQRDFWKEFFSYKFRMKALFGQYGAEPFAKVDEALKEFVVAANMRYESIRGDRKEPEDPDLRKEFDAALWGHPSASDKIAPLMHSAIASMEDVCIPIVQARSPARIMQRWIQKKLLRS
ncbi:MAG: hypothetical protein EOS22_04610 [Mesorhizobium sp.]|uniref:hypothetical protein n=1 Tax=Mesorhizobium sp. TaxID=1871066 RepID=UPI000FE4956A|nr:hypothetical protein [Mesorhizobium sp.]RWD31309.1 MAG: hypothetical protein EOS22_04610 [Mesorhizobium sp.]